MSDHCSCAGKFSETISLEEFRDQLVTFRNIAEYIIIIIIICMKHLRVISCVNSPHYYILRTKFHRLLFTVLNVSIFPNTIFLAILVFPIIQ